MMLNFSIDKEFKEKIPPMPQEAFEGLEADILRDGFVRDPLVVWKEENLLLDGHHRAAIIEKHWKALKDKFTVVYMSFPDRWAAVAWICANQLHKHNLDEMAQIKLVHEEYEARQKSVGAPAGNQNAKKQFGENRQIDSAEPEAARSGAPGKELTTRPLIAKEHGFTESYVKTAVEVGRGIDKGEEAVPGFKEEVLSGKVKASKKDLAELRKLNTEQAKERVEAIRAGKKVHFPSDKKRDKETDIPAPTVNRDPDAVVEYGIDDLLEEMRAVNADFLRKYRTMLSIHAQLVSDNAAEVATVFAELVTEFEKMEDF